MASIISAGTTSGTALNMTADTSGQLQLATGASATTALTIDTSQNATFAGKITSAGALNLASNGSTTAVTIDTSQNVGIGTTSPSYKLQASNTNGDTQVGVYDLASGSSAARLDIRTSGTGASQWLIQTGNTASGLNGALRFYDQTVTTERMRIDSSGNVLVGTTSGVAGGGKIQIANGTSRAINTIGSSGDVSIEPLRIGKFDNNSTTSQLFIRFTINNDNAGSGQINANGASSAAFGSYSDISLKENIKLLPSQINNIMALKPSEFDYKDGSGHQIGFIAQEIQEVYPDVVSPDENGLLMVTGWSKTEARLVKCIQEQQTIINDLKARIETLESK